MARKSRRRSRRRRTRKRRGGTSLFGKDQNHETTRMRLKRMEENMKKEEKYKKAVKERDAMSREQRLAAFAKGSKGQAQENVLAPKGGKENHADAIAPHSPPQKTLKKKLKNIQ